MRVKPTHPFRDSRERSAEPAGRLKLLSSGLVTVTEATKSSANVDVIPARSSEHLEDGDVKPARRIPDFQNPRVSSTQPLWHRFCASSAPDPAILSLLPCGSQRCPSSCRRLQDSLLGLIVDHLAIGRDGGQETPEKGKLLWINRQIVPSNLRLTTA